MQLSVRLIQISIPISKHFVGEREECSYLFVYLKANQSDKSLKEKKEKTRQSVERFGKNKTDRIVTHD